MMPTFKCPLCHRETEEKKRHKSIQLYSTDTEHAVCDSCADVVAMLRGGSVEDSEVLIIRLSVFHRAMLARFAPFWGKTDAEVLKALAMRWIEGNTGVPNIMMLCQMNERVKEEIGVEAVGVKENCEINQETLDKTPDKPEASPSVLVEKGGAPNGAAVLNGFVFRDCISEPFAYESLTPVTHGKTTYYLDDNNDMMRIERTGYPCATHAYLADVLHLYDHLKDVKKLLKHIDHNRRPIITGFLKDVPLESLHPTKTEIKKECPEKDCINKSLEQCSFCTDKSRYENAKTKRIKEVRQLAFRMGVK